MHMADALVSPAVGGVMWAGTAGLIALSARKVNEDLDERKVPLMGVVAAFVFAAQMINFTIPGTGSSGHLGGGLLMAVLLGPHAAFLAMVSVLGVQALFFGDGGLLALGCNVINLGLFPCFVAYPLLYLPLAGRAPTRRRLAFAATTAAVVGLQIGSFAVVLETSLSGITELPFGPFLLLMQPIHLAIGVVEGLATAAILLFLAAARPEVIAPGPMAPSGGSLRRVIVGLLVAAALVAGGLSRFASDRPDGLEWAIQGVSGSEMTDAGTSTSGLVGSALTLLLALSIAFGLRAVARRRAG
ncbi:MAG: energy-coupling factor ABC transporter permease [Pseudomonadota bacterium]